MVERKGITSIQKALARDRRQQEQKSFRTEEVRVQLETIAIQTTAKYEREVEAARPEAQATVEKTIQPWFADLVSSDTYTKLMKWSNAHGEEVCLSFPILYYWPQDAIDAICTGDNRSFDSTAKFIVEKYKENDLERGIRTHAEGDEVWYAGFELSGGRRLFRDNIEGVRIWREPVVGMGYGFAMSAHEYQIPVDAQNLTSLLDSISPEVWIEFGKQIESGEALKAIERSIKPKRSNAYSTVDGGKFREEGNKIAQEYLKNRKWH